MINVQDFSLRIGARELVRDASFRVDKGMRIGLVGRNGAGKTTTMRLLAGEADRGDAAEHTGTISTTGTIGYLAQEASIFRKMTVEENLLSILEMTKLSAQERREKMENLLAEFRIGHVRNRLGTELSGGERRRVEIARCLAIEPQFILLDEPFAGVDPLAVADIQEIIEYLRQRGMGILITDHNVRETLHIVDRVYLLSEGKLLLEGDSKTIAESPIARKFYLGENFSL